MCRSGENEELRYSIRSLVKNAPKGNVWVVGDKPNWYNGNFIPVEQEANAYTNVRNQLRIVCETDEISNDFVLMNDDFFVINKISEIPTFYTGTLVDRISKMKEKKITNLGYIRLLLLSNNIIERSGIKNPKDYELHTPMIMNKEKLLPILKSKALWRSAYGNINKIGGVQHHDVKIYGSDSLHTREGIFIDINSEPFISGTESNFQFLLKTCLADMFTEPSIYESPWLDSNQRHTD